MKDLVVKGFSLLTMGALIDMELVGVVFDRPVVVGGGLTLIGPLSMDHSQWRKR